MWIYATLSKVEVGKIEVVEYYRGLNCFNRVLGEVYYTIITIRNPKILLVNIKAPTADFTI